MASREGKETKTAKTERKRESAENKDRSEKKSRASSSLKTIDHETIRKWVEERGGRPAAVKDTKTGKDSGLLRIDYPNRGEESALEEISWDDFFQKFDENKLAFLYQEKTAKGNVSRFSKFVTRD